MKRALVSFFAMVSLSACGGPKPPEVAMSTDTAQAQDAGVRIVPDKKSEADASSTSPLPGCGCSLCQPVVSDDACQTDTDCGPSAPCHADKSVGIAKAKPPQPGQQCTLVMMCQTTDANACGCVAGKCTLSPRKK